MRGWRNHAAKIDVTYLPVALSEWMAYQSQSDVADSTTATGQRDCRIHRCLCCLANQALLLVAPTVFTTSGSPAALPRLTLVANSPKIIAYIHLTPSK